MKRSAILQVFVFSFALCNAYGAAGGFPVHSPYIAPLSAAEKKEFMAKYPEYTKSINLIRANLKLIKMYCLHEFEENENRKEIKNFTTGDLEARLYRHSRTHNQVEVDKAAIELSDLRDELVRMAQTCRASIPVLGGKSKGLPGVHAR